MYTHIFTYTRTHIRTYAHACPPHIYMHKFSHTQIHAFIRTYVPSFSHTHAHDIQTCKHVNTSIPTCQNSKMQTYHPKNIHTNTYIMIHIRAYACISTYVAIAPADSSPALCLTHCGIHVFAVVCTSPFICMTSTTRKPWQPRLRWQQQRGRRMRWRQQQRYAS